MQYLKMELENQGNVPVNLSNTLPKRKRGRPRKDKSQTPTGIQKSDHIQGQGGYVQSAPMFTMTEASPQRNDASMVGQPVNGVIEATFEAGYYVSIRIGNSDTILRGVVLKPGRCFPPSIANDLGPQINQTVHTPVQSSNRKAKGQPRAKKCQTSNGSSSAVDLVKLLGDRGNLVPVVLQPANQTSGVAPDIGSLGALSKPAHLAKPKSVSVNQTQPKQMEKKDDESPLTESKIQVSVAKLPVNVVEELVTDVANMVKISSRSNEMRSENVALPSEQSKPFLVKPLHGMISGPYNQFPLAPMNFGYGRPGKMTELLLAMQGSVMGNQAADVQNRGFSWR